MTRISLLLWAGVTAVVGLVFPSDIARAAELKVLASVALTSALNELSPMYEKATGDNLSIGYGLAADLKKRLLQEIRPVLAIFDEAASYGLTIQWDGISPLSPRYKHELTGLRVVKYL